MTQSKITLLALAAALCLSFLGGCTESPFDSEIAPVPRQITGHVNLLTVGESREGVYIWLEGVNIATETDSAGDFTLELPKELSESGSAGLSGVFTLYFFIANYAIETVDVVMRNGLFVYGEGDLNENGRLVEAINMFKILEIDTRVEPRWARNDYAGPINVILTVQATQDTVIVIFPKSVGGLLGGILLRNVETGQVFIDIPDIGADTRESVAIGNEPKSRLQVFQLNGTNFRDLFLPIGNYRVIPFFFIEHNDLPAELLNSISPEAQEPTTEYLKIPFRRSGGRFRIIG